MMREFVDSGLGRINGQMIPPGKTRADYPNFCDNETVRSQQAKSNPWHG